MLPILKIKERKDMMQNQLECKNAMYFKARDYSGDDMVLINEKIHQPDGSIVKNLRYIENMKKPVYIHKQGYRKYKQKQVWKPKDEMEV